MNTYFIVITSLFMVSIYPLFKKGFKMFLYDFVTYLLIPIIKLIMLPIRWILKKNKRKGS